MVKVASFGLAVAIAALALPPAGGQPKPAAKPGPVLAWTEATQDPAAGRIPQLAFDGKPDTYFESGKAAARGDQFTLAFEKPVTVKALAVATGRPDGQHALTDGVLEVSADGKDFIELAKFTDGTAKGKPQRPLRAIRVRVTGDLAHPLAVREFTVESDPPLTVFRYPVHFVVDVSDAPDMKDWAHRTARLCERHYSMICDELMSDGFTPPTVIHMALRNDYKGVAQASRNRILGSAKYFKDRPNDVGAMVHETAHCVQLYPGGKGNPGWLVEGVADYVRFYKYEPVRPKPFAPERAKYDGSYQVTAAFLAYLVEKYDRELVKKLNAAMRAGKYTEAIWKDLTGKTLEELGRDWKLALTR